MAKVMIWPDIYREHGHWLPCVTLAKSLKDAGYTVEFMGIKDTEAIVLPYQVTFRTILQSIYPQGYSFDNTLEPLDQKWKPHHLLPICRGALDSVFTGAGAPNLLVGGYFTGLESLLIHYKYGIPIVVITTFLRHPHDDPAIHAKTKLLYMEEAIAQKIIDSVVPVAQAGMSIEDFIKPLELAKELIPCVKEFDFADDDWVHRSTVTYVEPMIARVPLLGGPPPSDPVQVPGGKRLIYGTSGSQVADYEPQAKKMFKTLIAMMKTPGMENYHLALATGAKILSELRRELGLDVGATLPSNVFLSDWVSQLDILQTADVVFMHGGLATIKESIWEKVPIVIIPHGKDQRENALRIRRSGVGLVSDVGELSATDLRQLLTAATASSWTKQNLIRMQALFAARENAVPKPSVQVISGVVPP
jgi:UDP-N-acetylglucosamine:LPS N-acetylglucosamine transferase